MHQKADREKRQWKKWDERPPHSSALGVAPDPTKRWVPPSSVIRNATNPDNDHKSRGSGGQHARNYNIDRKNADRNNADRNNADRNNAVTSSSSADAKKDAIFRKVRGILNKLTPEKFDKLSLELLNVGIDSQLLLKGIILLIFDKALDEPKYSSLYAQLCHRLAEDAPNFEPPDTNNTTFRRLLLNKCRDEFENRSRATEAFDKDGPLTMDEEEGLHIAKGKMLGNIKFIGELGKLEMLHEGILHKCIKQLLEKKRHTAMADMGEDLECLCQIMRTIGRRLDTDRAKAWMDQYFERMKMFMDSPELPSRIKFMLLDVIELRENKWRPRKHHFENNGPRTIRQVRQEAAKDYGVYFPPPSARGRANDGGGVNMFDLQMNGRAMAPMMPPPQMMNSRGGGLADIFGGPQPGFMGSGDIGTGPGVIHMDPFNSGYSSNMGRPRGQQQGGFPTAQFARGGGSSPRMHYENMNHPRNYNNNQQQQQGQYFNQRQQGNQRENTNSNARELPPRFRKQQQQQQQTNTSPTIPIPTDPTVPNMYVPGAGGGGLGPGGAPIMVPGVGGVGPAKSGGSGGGGSEEISLRPARNFSPQLKPNTPSMLPKSAQGPPQPQHPLRPPISSESNVTMMSKQPAITIKQVPAEPKAKTNKPKYVSRDELLDTVEAMMKTYLQLSEENNEDDAANGVNDAMNTLKELRAPAKLMPDAITSMWLQALDKSDEARDSVSNLITSMKEEGMLNSEHFMEAFTSLLDKMKELETDVPLVRSYVAKFAAQGVTSGTVTLADMADPMTSGAHYPLFLLILQQIKKSKDKQWLTKAFNESKINLQEMLPESDRSKERMMEILEERGLSFMFPLLRVQSEMWKIINADPSPNAIYKWIKDNIDVEIHTNQEFISILISNILRYITGETTMKETSDPQVAPSKVLIEKEKDTIAKYKGMLQAFLHDHANLQLVTVYMMQVHAHSNSFPKGMLLRLFMYMYDLEVIDEEVFLRWKEEVNDQYPGKGKALFQVNQWLTWLEQAEEESEEEDE